MNLRLLSMAVAMCTALSAAAQKSVELLSPDKTLKVEVTLSDKINWNVSADGNTLLQDGVIDMTVGGNTLGANPKLSKKTSKTVDETIRPLLPLKFAEVKNHYNQMQLDFAGGYAIEFRAYDDGVVSYEGVRGMEQMGSCTPQNSLWLPFMRNAVGPMDYTPGAMISMQPDRYRAERPNAASIGTRAYQMALYVVWESALQMMADNPSLYYRNEDCARFIASVPTTWDETRALKAEAGKLAVVAKRKGDKWYIGAITNNDEEERLFSIPADFLADGQEYTMTAYVDGENANRQAMHYHKQTSIVKKGDKIEMRLARNGGFAAVLSVVHPAKANVGME